MSSHILGLQALKEKIKPVKNMNYHFNFGLCYFKSKLYVSCHQFVNKWFIQVWESQQIGRFLDPNLYRDDMLDALQAWGTMPYIWIWTNCAYFDQCLECAAPKHWSKYTTVVTHPVSKIFIYFQQFYSFLFLMGLNLHLTLV